MRLDKKVHTQYKMKRGLWFPQTSTSRKQTKKTTQLQMCAILHEKGRLTQREEKKKHTHTQEVESRATKNYFQALSPNQGNANQCLTGFHNCSITLVRLPYFTFSNRKICIAVILCLFICGTTSNKSHIYLNLIYIMRF